MEGGDASNHFLLWQIVQRPIALQGALDKSVDITHPIGLCRRVQGALQSAQAAAL